MFSFRTVLSSTKGLNAALGIYIKIIQTGLSTCYSPGAFTAGVFSSRSCSLGNCLTTAAGVAGSTFLTGACLLPGLSILIVLSGELYIPNTSASASFVLIVTVGSPLMPMLFRGAAMAVVWLSPLRWTFIDEAEDDAVVDTGVPHFLPRSPIDRARDSGMLYSTPSSV